MTLRGCSAKRKWSRWELLDWKSLNQIYINSKSTQRKIKFWGSCFLQTTRDIKRFSRKDNIFAPFEPDASHPIIMKKFLKTKRTIIFSVSIKKIQLISTKINRNKLIVVIKTLLVTLLKKIMLSSLTKIEVTIKLSKFLFENLCFPYYAMALTTSKKALRLSLLSITGVWRATLIEPKHL